MYSLLSSPLQKKKIINNYLKLFNGGEKKNDYKKVNK